MTSPRRACPDARSTRHLRARPLHRDWRRRQSEEDDFDEEPDELEDEEPDELEGEEAGVEDVVEAAGVEDDESEPDAAAGVDAGSAGDFVERLSLR